MAKTQRMSFEGLAYYGAAGSTASTLIENRIDLTIETDPQMADTTVAGDGTAPPVEAEDVATIKFSCTLVMPNDTADAVVTALKTAAAAGSQVALRLKDYSFGKGYDGDVNVKMSDNRSLKDKQALSFTLTPNNKLRDPQLYV